MFGFTRFFGRRHTPESVGLELLRGLEDGTITLDPPSDPLPDEPPGPAAVHSVRLAAVPEHAREGVIRAINELVRAASEVRPVGAAPEAGRPAPEPVSVP